MHDDRIDVWQFTEDAPEYAQATADLWHWSTNYDSGEGPFTLFLDMIGWSDLNIGSSLYGPVHADGLGYVELDKLAKALTEYADRPTDVGEWVEQLMTMEGC